MVMLDEIRALDQRILETEVENLGALEMMLLERGKKLLELKQSDQELSHWLELEANASEIAEKLSDFRQLMSQNVAAAEQELRRLDAFQQQEEPESDGDNPDSRLIDRLG